MIQGKIIRAFFGTTKYCKYFLENNRCPNLEKCLFLHKLVDDKDIVIDSNIVFSYNEHINLAKKISKLSNPETINFLRKMVKPKKNVFPSVDFVLLNEDEKENYFAQGGISYVKSARKIEDNLLLDNINKNNLEQKSSNICHDIVNNNIINNNNSINNLNKNDSIYKSEDPSDLHKIFSNSITFLNIIFLNNNKINIF